MKTLLTALLLIVAAPALADSAAPVHQDLAVLTTVAHDYLQAQTAGLAGTVTISMGKLDPRMQLAACAAPQAFQQPGARAWGKTTVGLRCATPNAWTVY